MTAQHKRKRHLEENSLDAKCMDVEGSERTSMRATLQKLLIEAEQIEEDKLESYDRTADEIQQDISCYENSKADPNYVCNCFQYKRAMSERVAQLNNELKHLKPKNSFALFLADYKASQNK